MGEDRPGGSDQVRAELSVDPKGSSSHRGPGGRLYGRHKGPALSARQQMLIDDVLPTLAIDLAHHAPADLTQLFGGRVRNVWLEIGFGGGEHLAWQLENNSDVGLIGCEAYINGVAKLLAHLDAGLRERLRLHDYDARDVLDWLPDESLDGAFVLFPDPWPKVRHRKRRLVNGYFARLIADKLKPGGFLRFATDIDDYKRTGLAALTDEARLRWLATRAKDWRVRPDDWPGTRYEAKAVREGRASSYFSFQKT